MDIGQILSWVVGAVGLIGFYFAGKRVWWSWYINLACQVLWISYALVTGQPAFLVTAAVYSGIFAANAYKWTKEHLNVKRILKEMTDNKAGTVLMPGGVEVTYNMIEPEEESNLVKHARHELNLIGEEPEVIDWYIRVINSYSSFGHSGGSAWATTSVLEELLRFRPLTELTDDPEDWIHIAEEMAGQANLWQNRRDGRCFSNDGGKTYYNVDNNDPNIIYQSISKEQWLEDHAHVPAN